MNIEDLQEKLQKQEEILKTQQEKLQKQETEIIEIKDLQTKNKIKHYWYFLALFSMATVNISLSFAHGIYFYGILDRMKRENVLEFILDKDDLIFFSFEFSLIFASVLISYFFFLKPYIKSKFIEKEFKEFLDNKKNKKQ